MLYAIAVVLVLLADQGVKYWTTKNIVLNAVGADCVSLIDGVVHMTNIHNSGAAFGVLQDARWPLTIVSAVFVVVIIILISKEIIHTPFARWMAVLIVAGALGNCIDRLLYGYVVDMFEVEFFNFAVFNVADIFITVGGVLFCLHLIFHREPEAVRRANEPEFVRRRREEREAKAAPYDAIPPRGEHRTLAEELRRREGEDIFGEDLEFGAMLDDLAVRRAEHAAAPASDTPAPGADTPARDNPWPPASGEDFAAGTPSSPRGENGSSGYSLEDILREFGEL